MWQEGPGLGRGEGPQAHRALLGHGPRREHSLCSNQLPLPPGSPRTPSGAPANPPSMPPWTQVSKTWHQQMAKGGKRTWCWDKDGDQGTGSSPCTSCQQPGKILPLFTVTHTHPSGPKGTHGTGQEGGVVPECPSAGQMLGNGNPRGKREFGAQGGAGRSGEV